MQSTVLSIIGTPRQPHVAGDYVNPILGMKVLRIPWGVWVAQPVEQPALGFSPGHDFRVSGSSSASGSGLSTESAGDNLSRPLLLLLPCSLSL